MTTSNELKAAEEKKNSNNKAIDRWMIVSLRKQIEKNARTQHEPLK